jgi:hypothetical protein
VIRVDARRVIAMMTDMSLVGYRAVCQRKAMYVHLLIAPQPNQHQSVSKRCGRPLPDPTSPVRLLHARPEPRARVFESVRAHR